MRKLVRYALIAVAICAMHSCAMFAKIVVTGTSLDNTLKRTSKLTDTLTGKTVILVPMAHIGTEKAYAGVREYLDGLKEDGYVTFCEGMAFTPFHIDTISDITIPELYAIGETHKMMMTPADSLKLDTLQRKTRYILGTTIEGDRDKEMKKRSGKKKKYVEQSEDDLGLATEQDIWVDYSLADLIELIERYGPIPLTQYDFETPLSEPYRQKNPDKYRYGFTRYFRDDLLERRILESPHKKIAVVYGGVHMFNLKLSLRHLKGYQLDKKYKAHKLQKQQKQQKTK